MSQAFFAHQTDCQSMRGLWYFYKFVDVFFCSFFLFGCVLLRPPSFWGQDFPSLRVSAVLLSVHWSVTIPTILLSPCCQLDSWVEKLDSTTDVPQAHNTFTCSCVQTNSSTEPSQPLTSVSFNRPISVSSINRGKPTLSGQGQPGTLSQCYQFSAPPAAGCWRFPVWIQLANVKNLIKWPGREGPLSGANRFSNITAMSRHLQRKSSPRHHINTVILKQSSRGCFRNLNGYEGYEPCCRSSKDSRDSLEQTRFSKEAGSALKTKSWFLLRAFLGGRPASSLVFSAFRVASVFPGVIARLQAPTRHLIGSRLGNTHAAIKRQACRHTGKNLLHTLLAVIISFHKQKRRFWMEASCYVV